MFSDLVKARKGSEKQSAKKSEISDERLDEIMAELFGSADDEDDGPAPKMKKGSGYSARDKMLEKAEDEEDVDEEEGEEDMEKGMSRREMMTQVYSMVDDLSDDELDKFLSDRQIKKAQVMAIFEQMPTGDLKELVSSKAANGASPMEALEMAKGSEMDADDDEMDI
jgi:activator of HSP90 ATPase